jgi:hypothetical protein
VTSVPTAPPTDPTDPGDPGGQGEPAGLTAVATGIPNGYAVTVSNPDATPVQGWTVVLTIPSGRPTSVTGAEFTRTGNRLTFTPVAETQLVPPGGWVSFSVEVGGTLRACMIDGRNCG